MISRNLARGSVTLRFPDRLAPAPEYRGPVTVDPGICICCGICSNVCVSGAIFVTRASGGCTWAYDVGACTFCGRCFDHCPVDAISQTENLPHVYATSRALAETVVVPAAVCSVCGGPRKPVNVKLLGRAYGTVTPELLTRMNMCPACRAEAAASQISDASKAESVPEGDTDAS